MKHFLFILLTAISIKSYSQLTVDTTLSTEALVDKILIGNGIRVGNIKCKTDKRAIGHYQCPKNLKSGLKNGIILTTGFATDACGPNSSPGTTGILSIPVKRWKGDKDLNKLSPGNKPLDISILEFDFISLNNKVSFEYYFGSEEYKEYVGSRFNDVFGFFVSGPGYNRKNLALIPFDKKAVAINNINHKQNKALFIDNDPFINNTLYKNVKYKPKLNFWQKISALLFSRRTTKGDSVLFYTNKIKSNLLNEQLLEYFEYDAFTKKMKVEFYVKPYEKYHIKIGIGDVGDQAFDSGVFLEEKSFISVKDTSQPKFIDYIDKSLTFNFDSIFGVKKFEILEEEEHFEVNESTIIFFDSDSYSLCDSSKTKLNNLATMLNKYPQFKVHLTGHTDNSGNRKKNMTLSEKRATTVMYYLTEHGIERGRLNYLGHSSDEPIGDNKTPEGRALNRRVEINITEE